MKIIYKIAKAELQSLFFSPIAWLILILYTFQTGMDSGGRCDEGTRNGIWSDKRDFQILRGLGWCVDCCTGVSLFIYSIADNEFDEP